MNFYNKEGDKIFSSIQGIYLEIEPDYFRNKDQENFEEKPGQDISKITTVFYRADHIQTEQLNFICIQIEFSTKKDDILPTMGRDYIRDQIKKGLCLVGVRELDVFLFICLQEIEDIYVFDGILAGEQLAHTKVANWAQDILYRFLEIKNKEKAVFSLSLNKRNGQADIPRNVFLSGSGLSKWEAETEEDQQTLATLQTYQGWGENFTIFKFNQSR